jgi:hypothetical protein
VLASVSGEYVEYLNHSIVRVQVLMLAADSLMHIIKQIEHHDSLLDILNSIDSMSLWNYYTCMGADETCNRTPF